MVRTQIQLTEKQAKKLKTVAAETGQSMSELIRQGVDVILQRSGSSHPSELRRRAARLSGRFYSKRGDVSQKHDRYLGEAFRQ